MHVVARWLHRELHRAAEKFKLRHYPTMHALADEILKYRRAVRLLAEAIGWADVGAPFALIAPGPHLRPRRASEGDAVSPAA